MFKLIKDCLTDDSGQDYELVGVALFFIAVAFIFFAGYDLYKAYETYQLLILQKLALPPVPKFDAEAYGIGAGALLGGHGLNKLAQAKNAAPAASDKEDE